MKTLRLAALTFLLASATASAADMPAAPPAIAQPGDRMDAAVSHLNRMAVLLLIRAAHDVITTDDLPGLLESEAVSVIYAGPSEDDAYELDLELLSEGSYYLVSLRYLIEAGGAFWPTDRAAATYTLDALMWLRSLQSDLVVAVEERHDPLPIMERAERIRWQTEGYAEIPDGASHFVARDRLVADALAAALSGDQT